MAQEKVGYTSDEFIRTLNGLVYVASRPEAGETACYGFLSLLLVIHAATVLHGDATFSMIPQAQLENHGRKHYPDFGSFLCSYAGVGEVSSILRGWWEVKGFPKLNPSDSDLPLTVQYRTQFAEAFTRHYGQMRDQALAAFQTYPEAQRYRMLFSQGVLFALLEWENPKTTGALSLPSWNWVQRQEKSLVKALGVLRRRVEGKEEFKSFQSSVDKEFRLSVELFQRARALVSDPAAYPEPTKRMALEEHTEDKQQAPKAITQCEAVLDRRNLPTLMYFAEPMFTLAPTTRDRDGWRDITSLSPQLRMALRAMCSPPHANAGELTFQNSFFDPPVSEEKGVPPTVHLRNTITIIEDVQKILFVEACEVFEQMPTLNKAPANWPPPEDTKLLPDTKSSDEAHTSDCYQSTGEEHSDTVPTTPAKTRSQTVQRT